jgi:hypothetical protein
MAGGTKTLISLPRSKAEGVLKPNRARAVVLFRRQSACAAQRTCFLQFTTYMYKAVEFCRFDGPLEGRIPESSS